METLLVLSPNWRPDFLEHRSRRGLYGQVRMNRKGWQRQDRAFDALVPHPRLGLEAITNRNSGQLKPRHARCQTASEGTSDRSQTRYGDACGWH